MTHRELAEQLIEQSLGEHSHAEFSALFMARQKEAQQAISEGRLVEVHSPYWKAKVDQFEAILKRLFPEGIQ